MIVGAVPETVWTVRYNGLSYTVPKCFALNGMLGATAGIEHSHAVWTIRFGHFVRKIIHHCGWENISISRVRKNSRTLRTAPFGRGLHQQRRGRRPDSSASTSPRRRRMPERRSNRRWYFCHVKRHLCLRCSVERYLGFNSPIWGFHPDYTGQRFSRVHWLAVRV